MRKIKNFATRLRKFVKKFRQWINFCDEIAKIKSICEIFSQNSVNDFAKFYIFLRSKKIFFPGTCRGKYNFAKQNYIFSFKIYFCEAKIYFCLLRCSKNSFLLHVLHLRKVFLRDLHIFIA